MNATLIYNPIAGPRDYAQVIQQAAELWRVYGWRVTVIPTEYAGHATRLAREAADAGQDVVLAAGGDGTLGQVANGLAESNTIMAPLPVGTGNSLAKELRMPRPGFFQWSRLLDTAELLLQGRVQAMDLAQLSTGQYWLLWAGAGADGYLVENIEPRPKHLKRLGAAGYLFQSLYIVRQMPKWNTYIEIDGRAITGNYLVMVLSNCRLFGGGELVLTPNAVLDDGKFELWLFRGQNMLFVYRYLLEIKLRLHHYDMDVELYTGSHVVINTDPIMPVHTDGEPGGRTPMVCEMRPGVLRLLVPSTAPAGLFGRPGISLARMYRF